MFTQTLTPLPSSLSSPPSPHPHRPATTVSRPTITISGPTAVSATSHVSLLALLSSAPSLSLARALHCHVIKQRNADDLILNTSLLNMYAKSGHPHLARQVFDKMPEKNSVTFNSMIAGYMRNGNIDDAVSIFDQMPVKDKISWTALIDGFVKNGLLEDALDCFQAMQLAGVDTDYVTLIGVIAACAGLGALGQGLWVQRYLLGREFADSVKVMNSLIDMYSRCGHADFAYQVFSGMARRSRVSWNSMIVGFAMNGLCREAVEHFEMMQRDGIVPDGVSFTGVLTACSHAGWVEEGLKYYDRMRKEYRIPARIEHYGCVVDLLSRAGRLEEAMDVLKSMPVSPNEVVLTSLLAACRMHGNVKLAERVMAWLKEVMPHCDSNYVLLSNIYATTGKWDGVGEVRNMMKAIGVKKEPGISCLEIDSDIHEFVAGDKSHPHSDNIYEMLDLLFFDMKLYSDMRCASINSYTHDLDLFSHIFQND